MPLQHASPQLMRLIDLANKKAVEIFRRRMRNGLTPPQMFVLQALRDKEAADQTELGVRANIDRSTLSTVVRRLERKGLVDRSLPGADLRACRVRLTPKGLQAAMDSEECARQVTDELFGCLTRDNVELVLDCLARLASLTKGAVAPGGSAGNV